MSETAEAMSLFRAVGLGLLLCKILPPQMPHRKNGIRPIEPSKGQGLLRPLHVVELQLSAMRPRDYRGVGWIGFDSGTLIEIPRIANAIGNAAAQSTP